MKNMKYKVGNRVKIKSLDWYNKNKDKDGSVRSMLSSNSRYNFVESMTTLCGKVVTIGYVDEHRNYYGILEDADKYHWTDEMIEGLAEEKSITTNKPQFKQSNTSLEKEMEWNLPQGYQFKDENGNVIKATKIVLEKIKGI